MLTDPRAEYDYYHGGIPTFLRFRNLTASNHGPFYDLSSPVHSDFLTYITTLLSHKSPYTGLAMSEDPTVLAFETGNELGGTKLATYPPPIAWTSAIANRLKVLAPNTLVMSGSYGVVAEELSIAAVDIQCVLVHRSPELPRLTDSFALQHHAFLPSMLRHTQGFGKSRFGEGVHGRRIRLDEQVLSPDLVPSRAPPGDPRCGGPPSTRTVVALAMRMCGEEEEASRR